MTTTAAPTVPSYVQDQWWTPEVGEGRPILDASTGEEVARVNTEGLDVTAVIEHARTVGRRSLAAMTLHERALICKQLGQYLTERRDELYEISHRTGATSRDNLIDVDGGIGVLFTMSSKGRRELPNANVIQDGPVEPLSRDGSFLGEHVLTALPGVCVQINAFNFPLWGMLEKFAPAFVAGVPTIVKPAPQTGYLAETCVRMMVESGLLPEGTLQIVSGADVDLLPHLDYRDVVAFTGSAATAQALRSHVNVREGGVRFISEADSLNAAILGPDAGPDTPEFAAFVSSVMVEITAKAGQKCTAIRRVIVPKDRVDDVARAVADKIAAKIVLGDPRADGATMGALVSLEQLETVKADVQRLLAAGGRLFGSLEAPEVLTADGSRRVVEAGAFMSPVVVAFDDADVDEVHDLEAFGPVTSVIGYSDLDDAIRLAARGAGSLVATVCTNDPDVARTLVTGIAGHHGRVLTLNREDARTSTGHGSPVPHLVHGGPGRAGNGEELGGVRAIKHFMQRTAIQGSPAMLTAITGVWHRGAPMRAAGSEKFGGEAGNVHPFRHSLADLRVGDAFVSDLRQVRLEDITAFATETGDEFYAHTDQQAAEANPFFPGIVAHGYLLVSWAAGLFVSPAPGPVLANYGLDSLRFITPVAAGDSIRVELVAKRITPRVTDEYGEVAWDTTLFNQNDELVATYDVLTLVAKEWPTGQ
ncbi:phenylacetic acid degradation bifunctional protein PaaZ [Mobilicoccus caccae]|uniref:Phenylacetic acid degradation protein PaaN n=1 Tax=Mobilicoccus caccae TaxID=1859295 RepID=A0ABQ6IR21_9MICO|nr:phenylacetic acid degradation bifunctional protein PaaZ [Mobilicoccus caccae]GMA39172.1 putative phenylacetic acid degradation protein PaaN [Mobilicoccus caccae]